MPPAVLALRYMTRFRCIAEHCEDTCCAGLRIPVSAERYERMRAALAEEPEGRHLLARVELNPDPTDPGQHAFLPIRSDGHCPFLDADRLCALQRRHGEEVLSDACATFPRVVTRWGDRLEVVGSLACPEAARLCLLAEDAVEQVSAPADLVPRPEAARVSGTTEGSGRHAAEVRAAALRLLSRREYPLGARLLLLGRLALQLDALLPRGAGAVGDDDGVEARLAWVLTAFDDPATLEGLYRELAAVELPGGPSASILAAVLRTRLQSPHGERFGALARAVLGALGATEAGGEPEALFRAYAERRARLEAAHPARVEQYFHNYCVNHLLRDPHTESPNLLAYVFGLTARVALLRFALAGHPVVDTLEPGEPGADGARARLDAAAVETFQVMAKGVERHPAFLSLLGDLAGAGGMETLGKVLVFSRLC